MAKKEAIKTAGPSSDAISAKEAVIAATKYFVDVTGNTGGVTVEEIEEEGDHWLITLGYQERPVGGVAIGFGEKKLKTFKVHTRTGTVVSMKIREI